MKKKEKHTEEDGAGRGGYARKTGPIGEAAQLRRNVRPE